MRHTFLVERTSSACGFEGSGLGQGFCELQSWILAICELLNQSGIKCPSGSFSLFGGLGFLIKLHEGSPLFLGCSGSESTVIGAWIVLFCLEAEVFKWYQHEQVQMQIHMRISRKQDSVDDKMALYRLTP